MRGAEPRVVADVADAAVARVVGAGAVAVVEGGWGGLGLGEEEEGVGVVVVVGGCGGCEEEEEGEEGVVCEHCGFEGVGGFFWSGDVDVEMEVGIEGLIYIYIYVCNNTK